MPVNSREKGKRIERAAAEFFRELGYPGARRAQQYKGTESSADLTVPGLEWLHVEVKGDKAIRLGTVALDMACLQALGDADGRPWVVMWWEERRGWRWTFVCRSTVVTVAHSFKDAIEAIKKEYGK